MAKSMFVGVAVCLVLLLVWAAWPYRVQLILQSLALVALLPGLMVDRLVGVKPFSLPGILLAVAVCGLVYGQLRRRLPLLTAVAPDGEGWTRRQFLGAGALLAGASLTGYGSAWERFDLEVTRHRLRLPGLAPELSGLRLVLLADLHCGPVNPQSYLEEAIRRANGLQPDLVLIPGDFVSQSPRHFEAAERLIAALRPTIAVLGTLGNHDHWEGAERARAHLRRGGLQLLDNDRLFLTPERCLVRHPPESGLCLAGVGDLWEGNPDLEHALGGVPPGMPRLLLSHNPDFAEEAGKPLRVDLMLSGHTHGGQVCLPGLGPPLLPSRYGQKYASGLVRGPHWPVYVTRGVGCAGLPVRLGVRPELALFVLELAPG